MAVENEYSLRWQSDAHRALGEFLAAAMKQDLPAVSWTIATSGALVGVVDSLATTPARQRTAFESWAHWLGATVTPERVTANGVAHLYAQFRRGRGAAEVRGAIRAELVPPMDVEGGA